MKKLILFALFLASSIYCSGKCVLINGSSTSELVFIGKCTKVTRIDSNNTAFIFEIYYVAKGKFRLGIKKGKSVTIYSTYVKPKVYGGWGRTFNVGDECVLYSRLIDGYWRTGKCFVYTEYKGEPFEEVEIIPDGGGL